MAMTRGLRQALIRIGCLWAFKSGPVVEEPCPAEMADYDHVQCDNVTCTKKFSAAGHGKMEKKMKKDKWK